MKDKIDQKMLFPDYAVDIIINKISQQSQCFSDHSFQ